MLTYEQCLQKIIDAAAFSKPNALIQYGASYASAGRGMAGEERRVQILYILNNLVQWRGDTAREVKAALKEYGK